MPSTSATKPSSASPTAAAGCSARARRWISSLGREEPPTELARGSGSGCATRSRRAEEDQIFDMLRRRPRLDPPTHVSPRPEDLDRAASAGPESRSAASARPSSRSTTPTSATSSAAPASTWRTSIDPETNEPYLATGRASASSAKPSRRPSRCRTFLADAYEAAEEFCEEVGKRPSFNSGFLKTMLLRRVGSTIVAGRRTAEKMLGPDRPTDATTRTTTTKSTTRPPRSALYPLTRRRTRNCAHFLRAAGAGARRRPQVPRSRADHPHGRRSDRAVAGRGCIVFSQYFDSASWLAERLSRRLPEETIALYAGAGKSGLYRGGAFTRIDREDDQGGRPHRRDSRSWSARTPPQKGSTCSASARSINLDLPWNPTRLEQRKGRIQRIGQVRDEVYVYNMRYRGSVEDRVHQLLSSRLEAIRDLFGQLPDTLEDVWVAVALRDEERARQIIDDIPNDPPIRSPLRPRRTHPLGNMQHRPRRPRPTRAPPAPAGLTPGQPPPPPTAASASLSEVARLPWRLAASCQTLDRRHPRSESPGGTSSVQTGISMPGRVRRLRPAFPMPGSGS